MNELKDLKNDITEAECEIVKTVQNKISELALKYPVINFGIYCRSSKEVFSTESNEDKDKFYLNHLDCTIEATLKL